MESEYREGISWNKKIEGVYNMLIILMFLIIIGFVLYRVNIFRKPYTGKNSQKIVIISFVFIFPPDIIIIFLFFLLTLL